MKITSRTNYTVGVHRQEWEEEPETAELFHGIFGVVLNHSVQVVFVPEVNEVAPLWASALPPGFDTATSPREARLLTALASSYVVTPNDRMAGSEERFITPEDTSDGSPRHSGVVFYVTPPEFVRYVADLEELAERMGRRLYSDDRVDDLRGHAAVDFVARRIVASPWLKPEDAAIVSSR